MGKSLPSSITLHNYARIMSSSERITPRFPKRVNPTPSHKPSPSKNSQPSLGRVEPVRVDPARVGLKMDNSAAGRARVPLAAVVSNCVRRWFQDTLAEARAGDSGMQLLVGQMYNTGYGVRKDTEKGRIWIDRASKGRSSAWNVSDKQPGYNASDSESEDVKECRS